jgi:hypothetical protein
LNVAMMFLLLSCNSSRVARSPLKLRQANVSEAAEAWQGGFAHAG